MVQLSHEILITRWMKLITNALYYASNIEALPFWSQPIFDRSHIRSIQSQSSPHYELHQNNEPPEDNCIGKKDKLSYNNKCWINKHTSSYCSTASILAPRQGQGVMSHSHRLGSDQWSVDSLPEGTTDEDMLSMSFLSWRQGKEDCCNNTGTQWMPA